MTERAEAQALNNQAIILASGGEYIEAIACFKRAIIMQRDNYLLWYNLGITYRDCSELDNARAALEKAHQIAPEKLDVLETLATICIQQENYQESLYYAEEGLDFCPENAGFWNLRGVSLFNMEEYSEACECFEQALSLNPYYEHALYNLRDTYTELHNRAGAEECDKRLKSMKH